MQEIFWYEGYSFVTTFWTPYTDYKERIGQPFVVLGRVSDKEVDAECLPQWKIQFPDGQIINAYPEEIIQNEVNKLKLG